MVELKLGYDPSFAYKQFQAAHIRVPCMDIDQVVLDREYEPRALIETTAALKGPPDNPRFLAACDQRMAHSPQKQLVLRVAGLLKVPAYWVAFEPTFDHFAVRGLDRERWHSLSREDYVAWVEGLAK